MELNSEVITTPPRPAATVMLLRDRPQGLQVFLLKRHGLSDVLGGAYVFPGGKLDVADAELSAQAHLDLSPQALHAHLNEPDLSPQQAVALHVAALREAFEESGVLLAHDAQGCSADAAHATAQLRTGLGFNALLAQMGLRLNARGLHPWSRWITPRV
ncbi:MAG: hypothetical protein RLZZ401_1224, partial [Pseudomonadota bacterium]